MSTEPTAPGILTGRSAASSASIGRTIDPMYPCGYLCLAALVFCIMAIFVATGVMTYAHSVGNHSLRGRMAYAGYLMYGWGIVVSFLLLAAQIGIVIGRFARGWRS